MSLLSQKYPKYTLRVRAADQQGRGLYGEATVILTVTDSNDNAPVFVKSSVSIIRAATITSQMSVLSSPLCFYNLNFIYLNFPA